MNENALQIRTDPMQVANPLDAVVRCRATNRGGTQCGKPAIQGGTVCRMHGGAAPQVRQAAELRILKLVSPALAELKKLLMSDKVEDGVKMRAIKDVLDRAGLAPTLAHRLVDEDGEDRQLSGELRVIVEYEDKPKP